jgi:hypothetical protein
MRLLAQGKEKFNIKLIKGYGIIIKIEQLCWPELTLQQEIQE